MSQHPNVILKLTVKAQGTTRKLLRDLLTQNREEIPDSNLPLRLDVSGNTIKNAFTGTDLRVPRGDDQLSIGGYSYDTLVMEGSYDEEWQISGQEGDLVIFDLVTYGYGEEITLADLQDRADVLVQWATGHGLEHVVSVSANYW